MKPQLCTDYLLTKKLALLYTIGNYPKSHRMLSWIIRDIYPSTSHVILTRSNLNLSLKAATGSESMNRYIFETPQDSKFLSQAENFSWRNQNHRKDKPLDVMPPFWPEYFVLHEPNQSASCRNRTRVPVFVEDERGIGRRQPSSCFRCKTRSSQKEFQSDCQKNFRTKLYRWSPLNRYMNYWADCMKQKIWRGVLIYVTLSTSLVLRGFESSPNLPSCQFPSMVTNWMYMHCECVGDLCSHSCR